ncbi:glycosyl transferase family 1 [Thermoplasmatales archaeon SM1-50]|nr:MAG: glycosyl transferase family 1 [Thermoplasmatales archaeon SM1-50]
MTIFAIKSLDKYQDIIGDQAIQKIRDEASVLSEKRMVHINSTYQGGGVAEILNSLIILLNDVGIKTDWRILHGNLDFFTITKKFHNALQGERINLSGKKKEIYYINNVNNAIFSHINHDFVVVHDPQPLPIVTCYKKRQPWVWRCHIDISTPMREIWDYLKMFILKYDAMIISMDKFKPRDIPERVMPQYIIQPSIDPLNLKNRDIPSATISKYLTKYGIEQKKPLITQISRFDKWKDPEGIIKIFKMVKKQVDCQLILAGSMATDDPEGQEIFEHLEKLIEQEQDIRLIIDAPDIVINALQRASSVIVQKSIKEGFGITVSEALWKGTPVVASNVGGIPSQVINGKNGYLVNPKDYVGFADKISYLIKNPHLAEEMGKFGKLHVKNNFLITRHLLDYLRLMKKVI